MNVWIMVVIIVVVVTCGEVVKQAIEAFSRRGLPAPGAGGGGARAEELEGLREQVEALAGRLDRLQEEQRFLTGLLEERPPQRVRAGGESAGSATADAGTASTTRGGD